MMNMSNSKMLSKTTTASPFKSVPTAELINIKLTSKNTTCGNNTIVSNTIDINRVDREILEKAKKSPFQAYLKKSSIRFSYINHKKGRST